MAGLAGLSSLLLTAASASAQEATTARAMMVIAAPPLPARVAMTDTIVIGKVLRIEEKPVKAKTFPTAKDPVEYKIAVVQVETAVRGAKGMKEIRVGFLPPAAVRPGPGPIGRRPQPITLAKDQEACLFLTKHFESDFYVMPAYYDCINKKGNANFAKEMTEVKDCAKLLANPKAGLESKKADERYLTAALLIVQYRTPKQPYTPNPKQEPIDITESQKILNVLAEADWTPKPGLANQMGPQAMFFRLGLTAKDFWTPPANFKDTPEAAKKWIKDNAGAYRIQRYVAAK
jgi:hypothetical protein